jgi:hypothetical protein
MLPWERPSNHGAGMATSETWAPGHAPPRAPVRFNAIGLLHPDSQKASGLIIVSAT